MFPSFLASGFALAGAACMLGPIVIHLMNRSRFKTVHWGAMEFLREAVQSNRRVLHLRDAVLLTLRTLAVLFFGLALARPYWSDVSAAFQGNQPIHAVLLVDNSMSMGVETIAGTTLDMAKRKAIEFVESLPQSSRVTVLPTCGAATAGWSDPLHTRSDAIEAIQQIRLTDQAANISRAAGAAQAAGEKLPRMQPRIVLFSDQQRQAWRSVGEGTESLPEMQVVSVPSGVSENTWVEDLSLQDGLTDIGITSKFNARLRHQGGNPRLSVPVTFKVDGIEVDTQTVDFEAGDSVRLVTFEYLFDSADIEPGQPHFLPVEVELPSDRLPADDRRSLVVPIVSSLPVVFIDQWNDQDEDPRRGRFGETWNLRKLLAPVLSARPDTEKLIQIRHHTFNELDEAILKETLRDTRLTVIAGVANPPEYAVEILRQYVQQGGQLFIASGGEFDPQRWTESAWRDGSGILPLPLEATPRGDDIETAGDRLQPFRIATTGLLDHAYFRLTDLEESALIDLYTDPLFFKTVVPRRDEAAIEAIQAEQRAYWENRLGRDAQKQASGQVDDFQPWLVWQQETPLETDISDSAESDEGNQDTQALKIEQMVSRSLPHTLARYDNGVDFVVQRQIGKGNVVMMTTGIQSRWNTLATTNAIIVCDRILRSMIASTLPRRNFPVGSSASLVLPPRAGETSPILVGPDEQRPIPLPIRFVDGQFRGVRLETLELSGLHRIELESTAAKPSGPMGETGGGVENYIPISVEQATPESELIYLDGETFAGLGLGDQLTWVESGETIRLVGGRVYGHNWWKYLIVLLLVILLIEMLVAASPAWVLRSMGPNRSSAKSS